MARTGWAHRIAGAALALLVQAGFLLLAILSPSRHPVPREIARETILLLNPLPRIAPKAAPATIDARGRAQRHVIPAQIPALPSPAPPLAPPPSGIAGFGQALFGCTPENYANLTPGERAHCPKPGEGLAIRQAPDLMGSPSHAKNEARWAAQLARKNSPAEICPGLSPLCLAGMIASGDIADPQSWPVYETKQYAPEDLYKIEQAYDAWHRDHPVTPQPQPPQPQPPQSK